MKKLYFTIFFLFYTVQVFAQYDIRGTIQAPRDTTELKSLKATRNGTTVYVPGFGTYVYSDSIYPEGNNTIAFSGGADGDAKQWIYHETITNNHVVYSDRIKNDLSNYSAFFPDSGGVLKITPGIYTLSSNLTIADSICINIMEGGIISGNDTLTIEGAIIAGSYKIFDTHLIIVCDNAKIDFFDALWYGAANDSTAGDSTAVLLSKATFTCRNGKKLKVPAGRYYISNNDENGIIVYPNSNLELTGAKFYKDYAPANTLTWFMRTTDTLAYYSDSLKSHLKIRGGEFIGPYSLKDSVNDGLTELGLDGLRLYSQSGGSYMGRITLEDVSIEGIWLHAFMVRGFNSLNIKNCDIRNCQEGIDGRGLIVNIHNCLFDSVSYGMEIIAAHITDEIADSLSSLNVTNNYGYNFYYYAGRFSGGRRINISDNWFEQSHDDTSTASSFLEVRMDVSTYDYDREYIVVTNNNLIEPSYDGFELSRGASDTAVIDFFSFENNRIIRPGRYGIVIDNNTPGTLDLFKCFTIKNNSIYNWSYIESYGVGKSGMYLSRLKNGKISNNLFYSDLTGKGTNPVWLDSLKNILFVDNEIKNMNDTESFIYVDTTALWDSSSIYKDNKGFNNFYIYGYGARSQTVVSATVIKLNPSLNCFENVFDVTGTTQIDSIDYGSGIKANEKFYLRFSSTPTVTDQTGNIVLGSNFVAAADTILELIRGSGSNYEKFYKIP